MKAIWKVLIVLILVLLIAFIALYVYNEYFYDNHDYSYDDDDYDDDDEDLKDDDDSDSDDVYYSEDDDYEYSQAESGYDLSDDGYDDHTVVDSLANLVVLINFSDQKLETTEDEWADFYFGSSNSVATYYDDMSKGEFELYAADESYGEKNNGVIVITLNTSHPNVTSESSDREYDKLTDIFEEVLYEIDDYVDFSDYDTDGDGDVYANELNIVMIAAGYEENDYSWGENQVAGISIYEEYMWEVDGVYIGDYILLGELDMQEDGSHEMVTIGTACHETGHVLGLPDLYDTDYSSIGLGFHSLMSEGNYNRKDGERYGETPAPLIAWSRIYVGFIEPQTVTEDGVYKLYGQSTDDYNVLRIEDGNGYYLIENVDFDGYGAGIEEYMEHGGIAIWYIDKDVMTEDNIWDNIVNDDDNNRGVILIEAEGGDDLYEESLDYDNPDYNHYFAADDISSYETSSGILIEVLDEPGEEMAVRITFDN